MKSNKEKLESYIHVLDILLLCFAVIVAFGVTGEYLFHLSSFGRFTAIGVDGEAVLGFLSFLFNRRLRAIQDIEIASLKRDLAEANRLAEQDRLARARIELRLAPRNITEQDRQAMIPLLRPFRERIIDIIKCANDAEVDELTFQISRVLTDSGWKPSEYTPDSGRPLQGIRVEVDSKNPQNSEAGKALVSALSITEFSVDGPDSFSPSQLKLNPLSGTQPPGASVRLTIGRK